MTIRDKEKRGFLGSFETFESITFWFLTYDLNFTLPYRCWSGQIDLAPLKNKNACGTSSLGFYGKLCSWIIDQAVV